VFEPLAITPGSGWSPLVVVGSMALATAVFLAGVVPWLQSAGVLDHPNHRSLHLKPTPRGGGLAMLPAVVLVGFASSLWWQPVPWVTISCAVALGLLGFLDDRRGLGPGPRMLCQILAGLALVAHAPGHVSQPSSMLIALGVVGYINAFNFMDGVNGISGVHAILCGTIFLLIGRDISDYGLTMLAAMTAGSGVGFLPWNIPKAKVFLGDSGSYFLGCMIAGCAVLALSNGVSPIGILAVLWIYLVDTGSCLVARAARRQPIMQAHNDHVYQRLAARTGNHVVTTGFVALTSVVAPVIFLMGAPLAWVVFSLFGISVAYLSLPLVLYRLMGGVDRV
jgi:UDP-GlcNAc:undecaprenyl-phosphate GlcNAc-1-phosphate transferase